MARKARRIGARVVSAHGEAELAPWPAHLEPHGTDPGALDRGRETRQPARSLFEQVLFLYLDSVILTQCTVSRSLGAKSAAATPTGSSAPASFSTSFFTDFCVTTVVEVRPIAEVVLMILACPFCKAKADPKVSTCASCGKLRSRACPACARDDRSQRRQLQVLRRGAWRRWPSRAGEGDPGSCFIEETPPEEEEVLQRRPHDVLDDRDGARRVCAYSAVKTKVSCHRVPVKQTITVPADGKGNPGRSY
jgi:hypothetical protein